MERDEIAEIIIGLPYIALTKHQQEQVDKVLSITNRVPCQECGGTGEQKHHPIWKNNPPDKCPNPSCKSGWIYPDFQFLVEAHNELVKGMQYLMERHDRGGTWPIDAKYTEII